MEKNSKIYQAYLAILKAELIPAMGCTEPIALAYCASIARDTLGVTPKKVIVGASGSIIKNVKSVIVPNTGHMKGIEAACAAGIVAGKADKKLEVLADINEKEEVPKISKFLKEVPIEVNLINYGELFDCTVRVESDDDYALVRIAKYHTNVVLIEKNNKIIQGKSIENSLKDIEKDESNANSTVIDDYKKLLNIHYIIDFADNVDINDIEDTIGKQIEYNYAIAKEGINNNYGSNIGKIILKQNPGNENAKLKAMAAAGSDARMNGCEMPVIINSGSGNQGITVSVPIIQYAKDNNIDDDLLYRALVVSNLISIHEKTPIGTLSAFCGAVSAGAGAGAGLAYIKGGRLGEICETIQNALGIVSGIVCDGAKASCAGKIAASVDAGILGYEMYKTNNSFVAGDGIIKGCVEKTIASVGKIAREGMKTTNDEIINIMINNK